MSLDQVWQHSVVLGLRGDGLVVVVSNGQHAVVPGGDQRRAAIDAVSEACENADIEFLRRRFGIPTEEAELILDRFVKP